MSKYRRAAVLAGFFALTAASMSILAWGSQTAWQAIYSAAPSPERSLVVGVPPL